MVPTPLWPRLLPKRNGSSFPIAQQLRVKMLKFHLQLITLMPPLLLAKDHLLRRRRRKKKRRKRRKRRRKKDHHHQSHSLTQFILLKIINSKIGNIMLQQPQMEVSIKLTVWRVQSLQNHPRLLLQLLQQQKVRLSLLKAQLRPHQCQLLLLNKNGSNSKHAQVKREKFLLIMKILQMPLELIAKLLPATTTTQMQNEQDEYLLIQPIFKND